MAIFHADITVLDYETTGSVRGFEVEPWQIGMVTLRAGKIAEETMFESWLRVDPNRPFNPHAPGRHATLREELAEAPTPAELWPRVEERLTTLPLCAHNVGTEKKFTRQMAPMHRFGLWIDTLRIARAAWPGCPSYALEDLVVMLDLKARVDEICAGKEAHDALYDAVASAALLEHLVEQPGWGEVSLADLGAI